MADEPNEFNNKGTEAEKLIGKLCEEAFFQDFCFLNPYYAKGKELCDVLVVLGDTALVWQIKSLKLVADGRFNPTKVSKAIKQCRGAKQKLRQIKTIELTNVAGQLKKVDTSAIKDCYLIAAIEGGTEEFSEYYDESAKGNVHIFGEMFTRFATKHLNTVTDFITYLRAKEKFLMNRGVIIGGSEEDLLALFLKNNRTFGEVARSDANNVFFDIEGMADGLEKDQEYLEKLEADKVSGGWDFLIQKKREATPYYDLPDKPEMRDKFLAKMMSHTRFERRYLAQMFFEAGSAAANGPKESNWAYRRYYAAEGVTYVFAFMGNQGDNPDFRRKMLYVAALAARARIRSNNMVIALVTEREMVKSPTSSFDWVLLDMTNEELAQELTPEIKEVFTRGKFLTEPEIQIMSAYEYPSDAAKHNKKQKSL